MSDYGLTVHVGAMGAGKTYAMRGEVLHHVRSGRRTIVIDRMSEWEGVPPEIAPVTVGVYSEKDLRSKLETPAMLIVWRPGLGSTETATEVACQIACETPGPTAVAVPEAHAAWPKAFGKDPGEIWRSAVITECRHHDVAVLADTQRLSRLNTDLVELSRTCRMFAMSGKNDLDRVSDIGGPELVAAVKSCADKLASGEPGWHVQLGLRRSPPFEIVRYVAP